MVMILDSFASVLGRTLFTVVNDEVFFLLGVRREIEMLQNRLERMLAVLADAERHRFQSPAIDCWLMQVKDIMYDAEDIIEECRYAGEKLRSSTSQRPSSSSSSDVTSMVRFCFSPIPWLSKYGFRHYIGKKIKSANYRLDDVLKDIVALNLTSSPQLHQYIVNKISVKASHLVEPDMVGREEDTKLLAQLLSCKEISQHHKISVLAITGMAGIGKTTLAGKIYNDDKLRSEFGHILPIWVCVSQDFADIDLLRSIIKGAGGNPGDTEEKESLEPMLSELVKDNKLFLVLDDVWDAQVWEKLLFKPLQSCSGGTRVLMTTRDEAVAKCMGAVRIHRVEKLSSEASWSLLCRMVFSDDDDEEGIREVLKDTGMEIIKKCDGLPLALKAIIGVLRTKDKTLCDWQEVLKNPAWIFSELPKGVMGALYLSYAEMPPYLKKCFLYFAMVPEDCQLTMFDFVQLWIAEGFIEANGNLLMEELAEGYWKQLVQRSLLQPHSGYYGSTVCKMHDLLHSLARHLAPELCYYKDKQGLNGEIASSSLSMKPRRVVFGNGAEDFSGFAKEHVSLRSLIFPYVRSLSNGAIAKLRFLRMLNLRNSTVDELPNSLGDLKHLRYLNLGFCPNIRELPESIGNLRNLQFLHVFNCKSLQCLPKSIVNLCNLRCLNVMGTNLHSLPLGIGRLQHLVSLNGFFVPGCNMRSGSNDDSQQQRRHSECCNLEELGSLSQLKDLVVHSLDKASGKEEASAAALKSKSHLSALRLHCSSNSQMRAYYELEEVIRIEEVLDELCPPPCLDSVILFDYFGRRCPSWMTEKPSSFLPNLRLLELQNCKLCVQLPPLGLLPQLDHLKISCAYSVKIIGPEFFAIGVEGARRRSYFPKLRRLHFHGMDYWEEWRWSSTEEEEPMTKLFPCLHTLILDSCPKLSSLPEGLSRYATSLAEVKIAGAHSLREVTNLATVETLSLEYNSNLEIISNLPSVSKLNLRHCPQVKRTVNVGGPDTLAVWAPSRTQSSREQENMIWFSFHFRS